MHVLSVLVVLVIYSTFTCGARVEDCNAIELMSKRGQLWKQGQARNNWKEREFVLTSTPKRLSYFSTSRHKLKGQIDFGNDPITVQRALSSVKTGKSGSTEWRFLVKCGARTLLMAAHTEEGMHEWLAALSACLEVPISDDGATTGQKCSGRDMFATALKGLGRAKGGGGGGGGAACKSQTRQAGPEFGMTREAHAAPDADEAEAQPGGTLQKESVGGPHCDAQARQTEQIAAGGDAERASESGRDSWYSTRESAGRDSLLSLGLRASNSGSEKAELQPTGFIRQVSAGVPQADPQPATASAGVRDAVLEAAAQVISTIQRDIGFPLEHESNREKPGKRSRIREVGSSIARKAKFARFANKYGVLMLESSDSKQALSAHVEGRILKTSSKKLDKRDVEQCMRDDARILAAISELDEALGRYVEANLASSGVLSRLIEDSGSGYEDLNFQM
jgi:hypothetical protein